jgi:hypothetical protein
VKQNIFVGKTGEMSQSRNVIQEVGRLDLADQSGRGVSKEVLSLSAARTLLPGDSGRIVEFSSATGFTVTLPAISSVPAGWNAQFVVATAPTSGNHVVTESTSSDTNIIKGSGVSAELNSSSDVSSTTGATQINFIASTAGVASTAYVVSDGTNWHATAYSDRQGGVTFT